VTLRRLPGLRPAQRPHGRRGAGLLATLSLVVLVALGPAALADDLMAPAGRDLSPLLRLVNSPGGADAGPPAEGAAAQDAQGRERFARYLAALQRGLEAHPELAAELAEGPARWAPDLREVLVWGYLQRAYGAQMMDRLAVLGAPIPPVAGGAPRGRLADLPRRVGALAKSWGLATREYGAEGLLELRVGPKRGPAVAAVADAPTGADLRVTGALGARRAQGPGAVALGGLVANLYALRALADSGVELKAPVLLLLGSRGPATASAKGGALPRSLGSLWAFHPGGSFPLGIAENGLAELTLSTPPDGPGREPLEGSPGYRILEFGADSASATALLDPRAIPLRRAASQARRAIGARRTRQPELDLTVRERDGRLLEVELRLEGELARTEGAAAVLLELLHSELGIYPDACGRLARFCAEAQSKGAEGQGFGLPAGPAGAPPTRARLLRFARSPEGGAEATILASWAGAQRSADISAAVQAAATRFVTADGGVVDLRGGGLDPHALAAGSPEVVALRQTYAALRGGEPAPPAAGSRWPSATKLYGALPVYGPLQEGESLPADAALQTLGEEQLRRAARLYCSSFLRLAQQRSVTSAR